MMTGVSHVTSEENSGPNVSHMNHFYSNTDVHVFNPTPKELLKTTPSSGSHSCSKWRCS